MALVKVRVRVRVRLGLGLGVASPASQKSRYHLPSSSGEAVTALPSAHRGSSLAAASSSLAMSCSCSIVAPLAEKPRSHCAALRRKDALSAGSPAAAAEAGGAAAGGAGAGDVDLAGGGCGVSAAAASGAPAAVEPWAVTSALRNE